MNLQSRSFVEEDWRPYFVFRRLVLPESGPLIWGPPLGAPCTFCEGTGCFDDYGGPFDCGVCDGSGRLPAPRPCTSIP